MRISDCSSDVCSSDLYLADTLANTIGRAKLYVGRVSDQDEMGAPVPVEDGDQADVLDLLGSESERSQMLQRFGVNDFIAGEAWLVGMTKKFLIPKAEEDAGHAIRLATTRIPPSQQKTQEETEESSGEGKR